MGEYAIVPISRQNIADINVPNQPFLKIGRIVPAFKGGKWTYSEEVFEPNAQRAFLFPNDEEDWAKYIDSDAKQIYFLYEEGQCAAQIRIRKKR